MGAIRVAASGTMFPAAGWPPSTHSYTMGWGISAAADEASSERLFMNEPPAIGDPRSPNRRVFEVGRAKRDQSSG